MNDIAIEVQSISKVYKLYDNPVDRLKESLHPFRKTYHRDFYALKDISFNVMKGESFGIIGKNGAGKSTLLKILTGVLTPSSGTTVITGKVSALLELGAGFNPEMTGLENIYFSGTLMGFSRDEMNAKMDSILSFADIGDFINQPVKTYSSGMFVRLAFSIAIIVEPDIFIVDEALSVGDFFFQLKCKEKLRNMIDSGLTLLFVSHDLSTVKTICRKSILLDNGRLSLFDNSDKVVSEYLTSTFRSQQNVVYPSDDGSVLDGNNTVYKQVSSEEEAFINNVEFLQNAKYQRVQNGRSHFANVQLLDEFGNEAKLIEYDQKTILRMAIEIDDDIPKLGYGYHIMDKNGLSIVYSDCHMEGISYLSGKKGERYILDWKFKAALTQGKYVIRAVLSIPIDLSISKVDFCDYVPVAVQFEVMPRNGSLVYGYIHWNNEVFVKKLENNSIH